MSQAHGSFNYFPSPTQPAGFYFLNDDEAAALLGGGDLDPTASSLAAEIVNSEARDNNLITFLSTFVKANGTRLDA